MMQTTVINTSNTKRITTCNTFKKKIGIKDNKIVSPPNWSKLKSDYNLMHDATYRQYALTVLENHDMQ